MPRPATPVARCGSPRPTRPWRANTPTATSSPSASTRSTRSTATLPTTCSRTARPCRTRTVQAIRTTAEMRFARDFSPDAFETYVVQGDTGGFVLQRLPAEDDPMLDRVRKVREREYLFIDTLDEYFEDFSARMHPTYQDWRQATYSEAIAYREQREKAKRASHRRRRRDRRRRGRANERYDADALRRRRIDHRRGGCRGERHPSVCRRQGAQRSAAGTRCIRRGGNLAAYDRTREPHLELAGAPSRTSTNSCGSSSSASTTRNSAWCFPPRMPSTPMLNARPPALRSAEILADGTLDGT